MKEQKMKSEKGSIIIFILTSLLVIVSLGFMYYAGMVNKLREENERKNIIINEYKVTIEKMEEEYDKINKN